MLIYKLLLSACMVMSVVSIAAENTEEFNNMLGQDEVLPQVQYQQDAQTKELSAITEDQKLIIEFLNLNSNSRDKTEIKNLAKFSTCIYSGGKNFFRDAFAHLNEMRFFVKNQKQEHHLESQDSFKSQLYAIVTSKSDSDLESLSMGLCELHREYAQPSKASIKQQSWGAILEGYQAPLGITLGAVAITWGLSIFKKGS